MTCHEAKMSENGIFWQKKGEKDVSRLKKPAKTADFIGILRTKAAKKGFDSMFLSPIKMYNRMKVQAKER